MLIVGLTGGIASGKTVVSGHFQVLGAPVVDTDVISRQLVEPDGPALAAIVDRFGSVVLTGNGTLDRRALRALVFNDPQARGDLERILHPRIQAEVLRQLQALDASYCIVVVPLLVGSALLSLMNRVVVVDVPEEVQIQRVMARDGVSEALARSMLAAQASRAERLAIADHVITNTGSLEDLYAQVDALDREFRAIRN